VAIITTLLKQKVAGNSSESGFKPSVWPLVEFMVSMAIYGDGRKDLQQCKTCYHRVNSFYCLHVQCLTDFLLDFPCPHFSHHPHCYVPVPNASVPDYTSSHPHLPPWHGPHSISHLTGPLSFYHSLHTIVAVPIAMSLFLTRPHLFMHHILTHLLALQQFPGVWMTSSWPQNLF